MFFILNNKSRRIYQVKYANQISEMLNAFMPEALKTEQMEKFYCNDTMEYRTGDKYISPIEDILEICQNLARQNARNAFLLLGHQGCGKSTELNRMSEDFISNGYPVKTVVCSLDLDLLNISNSDLFILMGEALLKIAEESKCEIDEKTLDSIMRFWDEGMETTASQELQAATIESEISAGTPGALFRLLNVFTKIKADLKYNEETRKEYRKKISNRSSEWIDLLNHVSNEISVKTGGKFPIIIFEDLDKLNPEDAWKVFDNYAASLSGMKFPVIYTFPIGLSYDSRFSAMESYFIIKTLPMIKIEKIDGGEFPEGIAIIRKIVEKRTNLDLFDSDVLDKMILFTGGSLRDLFYVINASASRAVRRKSATISIEDADRALEELKTSLTRRIERKDYDFLLNICKGNREVIEDKKMLLNMLEASVVLEYNGKRWHNVHPLVEQFFKDQGLIEDVTE